MSPEALERELVELARAAGFEVRAAGARAPGEPELAVASGICRVRGRVWVVLSSADSGEERIAALARGLVEHAPQLLEGRYLPPAVRERLDAAGASGA